MHIILIVFLLFLGASWGSFLNVIAYRMSVKKTFISGRSYCTHCKKSLHWYDMIPIISFLALRGKCRFCAQRISAQYLLAEIGVGLLFVLGGMLIVDMLNISLYIIVVSFFTVLFIYDAIAYLVPDRVAIHGIIIIGLLNFFILRDAKSIIFGGIIGGAWFLIQFILSKGKWVGGGDIRIGILLGVLVGYPLIWLALGISYVGGSLIALVLIILRMKTLKSRLPFATLLLPSGFIIWLWGSQIWQWYVGLIS